MAYHGGQKKTKTKKTKQKKGQKKSNVQTTVKNVGGKFQAQVPTQNVDETREEQEQQVAQAQEQTNAEQMVQQMMEAGASAESMYQQTQAAQEETQEQSPIELSGTVFMPSPSSNTWVVQNVNGDANLIEAGMNITLLQFGQTQDFEVQSISGTTIILNESVPNQNIGSTVEFFITTPPENISSQQTQEPELFSNEPMPISPPTGYTPYNPMIGTQSPLGQWTWSGTGWNHNDGTRCSFNVVEEGEPKPTSPPLDISPMDQKIGTLSPLEQWIWQGLNSGWVEYIKPPPPLPAPPSPPDDPRYEVTTTLYPGTVSYTHLTLPTKA